jgi:hypothetical protein
MNLVQKFVLNVDGKDMIFDSKQEALDYLRKPKVLEALKQIVGGDQQLANWLLDHQEQVEVAFESGAIKRVTKSEGKKLKEAMAHICEVMAGDKKAAFVTENAEAIVESFRWPSVKRMTDEEKSVVARNTLVAASEGNKELAEWIIANKDAVLGCYEAGIEKRQVNPKAAEALAAYRAKKAAEKQALSA